jgi:hypothetical protein
MQIYIFMNLSSWFGSWISSLESAHTFEIHSVHKKVCAEFLNNLKLLNRVHVKEIKKKK